MPKTWFQYKQDVRSLLTDITPSDDLFALAVADFVKAMVSREVDKDLVLYRSYWDSYNDLKRRLVGYLPTTLQLGSTLDTEVRILLTVDGDREGLTPYVDKQIKNAYLDLSTFAVKVNKMIREAVIDLQSHIPCYRFGQETIYTTDDVTDLGNYSRGMIPEQGELQQVLLIEPVPALLADTFYSFGDRVSSNDRTYVVKRAGTTPSDLGDGLETTDGSLEILGSAGFVFFSGSACIKSPFTTIPWKDRNQLDRLRSECGAVRGQPLLVIDQESRTFYAWPKLVDDSTYLVFWNGLKLDFLDGEFVNLDETSEDAVKEYVLSELTLSIDKDRPQSGVHRGRYEILRSRLFADCSQRLKLRHN